ncbi:MAG: hypothetical protein PWQ63_974 [Methanolobus sp.]|jgi:hypothetical protein|nr:hypothetical protein [Methanolobus sp.]MDK2947814.1 hypothetical protein [Methanolobus sp.]
MMVPDAIFKVEKTCRDVVGKYKIDSYETLNWIK